MGFAMCPSIAIRTGTESLSRRQYRRGRMMATRTGHLPSVNLSLHPNAGRRSGCLRDLRKVGTLEPRGQGMNAGRWSAGNTTSEETSMSEAKTGKEFITHELDEAIAVQRAIVKAEESLSREHPSGAAK